MSVVNEYQTSRIPNAFKPTSSIDSTLSPDAFLGVNHNEKVFKVAIEIELTQKSAEKVYLKFNQYKDSDYFDYVIYFFKSKSILNSYRKRLNEMLMEIKNTTEEARLTDKILFLYSAQKNQYGTILKNSSMECHSKELSIEKFFGAEITILNLDRNNNIQ